MAGIGCSRSLVFRAVIPAAGEGREGRGGEGRGGEGRGGEGREGWEGRGGREGWEGREGGVGGEGRGGGGEGSRLSSKQLYMYRYIFTFSVIQWILTNSITVKTNSLLSVELTARDVECKSNIVQGLPQFSHALRPPHKWTPDIEHVKDLRKTHFSQSLRTSTDQVALVD